MTVASRRMWTWGVRAASVGVVGLLWWLTAGEDAEWALWRHYSAGMAALNVVGSGAILAAGYVLAPSNGVTRMARAARVALLGFGGIVALTIFEVPAVFGHSYAPDFGNRNDDTWIQLALSVNRPDPELLHVHRPNTRYRGTVTGNLVRIGIPSPARYPIDVAYDKNGFRNSVDLTRADLVAIGDSFVEAAEIPETETVVAQLGRRLGRTAANLGQAAYGPQQELIVLERYGVPLSPKQVVWFFFGGNDLRDTDAYEWGKQHYRELLGPGPFSDRSFARNALRTLARLTTPPRRTPALAARLQAGEFTRASGETEVIYFDAPEGAWEPRQWSVATSTLQRARDVTHRMGADLLVVYIPRKLRVYRGFVRVPPDSVAHSWPENNLPDALGAWTRDQGIEFLDSTVVLREAVAQGHSVYLPDDVHWNAKAHEVVADAIARYINQRDHRAAALHDAPPDERP